MSELFKALQKLEEQNAPEVPKIPQAFSPSSDDRKSKKSPPFLKSILLCILLLVFTVICLGFIWFARDDYSFSPTVTNSRTDREKEHTIPVVEPISSTAEKTILPTTTLLPEPVQVITQEPFSPAEKTLVTEKENTEQLDTKIENSAAVAHEKSNSEITIHPMSLEQFIEDSTSNEERKRSRDRQRKRIVFQAEKMREQSDLPRALNLYKKAWSLDPNSDIANNLAAILIQSKQYEEAEDYLRQAISLAPDDKDLRFNIEIAREGRKRENLKKQKNI